MSVGASILGLMGKEDPRMALLRAMSTATAPPPAAGGAQYAAAGAPLPGPQQGPTPAAAGAPAPAATPDAFQSPPDLSALYSDLLKYNSKESNINRGFGLIGSAVSQDGNRQSTLNAFQEGRGEADNVGLKDMGSMVQEIQKLDIARQQRAAMLASVPAIAKQYGLSSESAMLLAQSGQLDEFIKEAEKPNSVAKELPDGRIGLIDQTRGDMRAVFGDPRKNNQVIDQGDGSKAVIDINNPAAGKSMLSPATPDIEIRQMADGTMGSFNKRDGSFLGVVGPKSTNNQMVDQADGSKAVVDLNNPASGKSIVSDGKPDWKIIEDPREGQVRVDLNDPTKRTVLAPPKTSPERVEYEDYKVDEAKRDNGSPLSFQQWRMTKPPSVQVNNNMGANGDAEKKSFMEKSGQFFAEDYQSLRKGRNSARDMMNQYDLAEDALKTGVNTGALGEAEQYFRKIGQSLGLDTDPSKVQGGEVLKTVTNRMALLARNPDGGMGLPGSVSDRDLTFLKDMQPGLSITEGGNKDMLRAFRLIEKRKVEIADLADQYVQDHGKLDAGFDKKVREFADSHALFDGFKVGENVDPAVKRQQTLDFYLNKGKK